MTEDLIKLYISTKKENNYTPIQENIKKYHFVL